MRSDLPVNFFVQFNDEQNKEIQNLLIACGISYQEQNLKDCLKSPHDICFLIVKENSANFLCLKWVADIYMNGVDSCEFSFNEFLTISRKGTQLDPKYEENIIPASIAFFQGV